MAPKIRSVRIITINHNSQRYDTVGDWLYDETTGEVVIYVSELGDWRMNMACGLHEFIETALCVHAGVHEPDVSAFDVAYEVARAAQTKAPCGCVPTMDSEPGEDRHAPYRKQHAFADGVERLFADAVGIVWSEYNDAVYGLKYRPDDPFAENGEATEMVDDVG